MSSRRTRNRKGMPPWVPRLLLEIVGIVVGLFVVFHVFRALRGLIVIVLISLFLSVALEPGVNYLSSKGWRRGIATGAMFLALVLSAGTFVGLMVPLKETAAEMQFATRTGYLYLILAFVVAGFVTSWWLKHSRYGAWLQAVRDNEESAAALGVNVFRVKLQAIVISGALMAAGGAFYVQYLHYIDPHIAYGPGVSVEALLAPIVGGMGTVWGPLLGAALLHALGETTRNIMGDAPGINLAAYGIVLILMITFMPRGVMGLIHARPGARTSGDA